MELKGGGGIQRSSSFLALHRAKDDGKNVSLEGATATHSFANKAVTARPTSLKEAFLQILSTVKNAISAKEKEDKPHADKLLSDRKAKQIPMGLKYIVGGKGQKGSGFFVERSGGSYAEGERVGRFTFVENKKKGVEPGFIGKKAWLPADTQKMKTDGHKFSNEANAYIKDGLKSQKGAVFKSLQDLMLRQIEDKEGPLYDYITSDDTKDISIENMLSDPKIESAILNHIKDDPEVQGDIINHVQNKFGEAGEKFGKRHYVKMDYKEADVRMAPPGVDKRVRVSKQKGKGIQGVLHREVTAKRTRDANRNAVRECLANDLSRLFGMEAQKLKIVKAEYEDGTSKLMLDGTHMGNKVEGGVQKFEDFAGKIKDGYIVDESGKSQQGIPDLGAKKIFFLLMGDRDAVGKRGDNKGMLINPDGSKVFASIDPGHSLETGDGSALKEDAMRHKNLHSDFSFDQPNKLFNRIDGGFKNFTVFDDTSFTDKFQGVIRLAEMRESGEDVAIFDQYIQAFGEKGDLDFAKDLKEMKEAYIARRDYILDEVFAQRLQFKDQPEVLSSLDALEKLTSDTATTSPSGEVELKHLRVVDRQEWHISKNEDGSITLSTTAKKTSQANELDSLIQGLAAKNGMDPSSLNIEKAGKEIKITIKESDLDAFTQAFNEDNVKALKHPPQEA